MGNTMRSNRKLYQVACWLECALSHTLSMLAPSEKCLPWYYPAVDNSTRMCNPFEARNFSKIMKKTGSDQCKVIINFPG